MRKRIRKILVTGGAGFIGSAFVRLAVREGYSVSVIDKITYAGDLARLSEVKGRYRFYKADICDAARVNSIFSKEKPDALVHFAAESHVDRSIKSAHAFVETNISGTYNLLETSRRYKVGKFIHISTDEVYGEVAKGKFKESHSLKPNSPYSATKAAADLLISSYVRTYGFPAAIVRPCNNYGPWQYPEKLIPLAMLKLLRGEKIPIYGKGKNVREWLYVDDCAKGILRVMEQAKTGEVYNLGSGTEKKNLDLIGMLLKHAGFAKNAFCFVKDRPGHDLRYSLDSSKLRRQIGWRPSISLDEGLKLTVLWCRLNNKWLFKKSQGHVKYY